MALFQHACPCTALQIFKVWGRLPPSLILQGCLALIDLMLPMLALGPEFADLTLNTLFDFWVSEWAILGMVISAATPALDEVTTSVSDG